MDIKRLKPKITVSGLVLGFAIGLAVSSFLNVERISFLDIEMDFREVDDIQYLERVWEDETRRENYLVLLAGKGVFLPSNPTVVDSIATLCDEIPRRPLEDYLAAAQTCADKPVSHALRELAQKQEPPFHPIGRMVTIGVPESSDQPPTGGANTCQNGDWFRRHVTLTNTLDGRQITVHATGHYGSGIICGSIVGAADLQLNEHDALQILDGPLGKFEQVLAVIE